MTNEILQGLVAAGRYEAAVAEGAGLAAQGRLDAQGYALWGIAHSRAANLDEAVRCLKQAVALEPGEALHRFNLANLCRLAGALAEAASGWAEAIRLQPGFREAWQNLLTLVEASPALGLPVPGLVGLAAAHLDDALMLYRLGRLQLLGDAPEDARRLFSKAVALAPDFAQGWYGLALARDRQGDRAGAISACRRCVALAPESQDALLRLGTFLLTEGGRREAKDLFLRAARMSPPAAQALAALAGIARDESRLAEAEAWARKAVAECPQDDALMNNLGTILLEEGRVGSAEAWSRRSLAQNGANGEALANLGAIAVRRGKAEEGLGLLERAQAGGLDDSDLQRNIALAKRALGRGESAEGCLVRLLRGHPGEAEAAVALSSLLLGRGALEEGWHWYRRRFEAKDRILSCHYRHPQPEWGGSRREKVLFWGDQGIADELWFGSLLPEALSAVDDAVVECDPRLVSLLRRSLPGARILARAVPPGDMVSKVDRQCAFGDLGGHFRRAMSDFPPAAPWLVADPEKVLAWRRRLAGLGTGPWLGVTWRSTLSKSDLIGSVYPSINEWADALRGRKFRLVSLQYDRPAADLAKLRELGVFIYAFEDLDLWNDQEELAALISALQGVIGVANTPVVLAAGLGAAVYTLWSSGLRIAWRLHGRQECPWFPAMKVVRHGMHSPWKADLSVLVAAAEKSVANTQHSP